MLINSTSVGLYKALGIPIAAIVPSTSTKGMTAQTRSFSSVAVGDVESAAPTQTTSLWSYLTTDVDAAQITAPLAAYCFMTGYM